MRFDIMHADMSKRGASFIAKRADDNPRQLLIGLIEQNPALSKDDLFALFQKEIDDGNGYRRAVDWYFFVNMYEYATTKRPEPVSRAESRMQEHRAASKRVVEQIKRQILLLDLPMPNGKPMRDCTGSEMATFGNRYQKIADRIGKKAKVGEILDEDAVRDILK